MATAGELLRKEYLAVEADEPVASLIGKLVKSNEWTACVLDNSRFIGLFAHDLFLKSRFDIKQAKVRNFVKPVPHLEKRHGLAEIATLMFDSNAAMLPVFNGKMAGVVHVFDVLRRVKEEPELKKMRVMDARHPKAITIPESETINKALEIMHDEHIDRMPVADENGKIAGFLSHIDVMRKYYAHHIKRDLGGGREKTATEVFEPNRKNILKLPVSDFMSKGEILSVSENDLLQEAARKMADNEVLSLLVRDAENAIITKRDILEAIANTRVKEVRNIQYVGLERLDIDEFTRKWAQKIASYYAEKISFLVKNEFSIAVHIKEYKKSGKSHKFSIHSRVSFPGGTVASGKSHDWDLRRALHKSFRDLEHRLSARHKLKTKKGAPSSKEFY